MPGLWRPVWRRLRGRVLDGKTLLRLWRVDLRLWRVDLVHLHRKLLGPGREWVVLVVFEVLVRLAEGHPGRDTDAESDGEAEH